MSMFRAFRRTVLALALLVLGQAAGHASEPLFSFGEMRQLQTLPDQTKERVLGEEELLLYQNMEFYSFTAFEALLAANNAALALGGPPLFCAPAGTFAFHDGADIAALLAELTENLLALIAEVGAREDHYDRRPASETLLFALRATFPCDGPIETISATR